MSYPYYYYGQGATFYAPQPFVYAPAPAPTAAPKPVAPALPSNFYAAADSPATTADLSHLQTIHARTKPLVEQTEALANEIFPNDGEPIVQNGVVRTKYGK